MFVVVRDNIDGDQSNENAIATVVHVDKVGNTARPLVASIKVEDGKNSDKRLESELEVSELVSLNLLVTLRLTVRPNDLRLGIWLGVDNGGTFVWKFGSCVWNWPKWPIPFEDWTSGIMVWVMTDRSGSNVGNDGAVWFLGVAAGRSNVAGRVEML